ncbi:39kDa virion core protein [Murmansk poxvirus]|uniref:39kDa core protein OPG130 n=1 Tax=Murmansk poxvirus TaxID=2025359 RepID=A0A223FMV4_9POXV|nr:39kDa virion core protein [Murmansk poxvirus]AST09314.1 39kDa virion core protein [Murmansk poxvirus]
MDFLNKFGNDLASSSTPKSSIYYSKEMEIEDEKNNAEIEMNLKNHESYYQRQLREVLANNNNKVNITPTPAPKSTQMTKPQSSSSSVLPNNNQIAFNIKPTKDTPMSIIDFINKFNNDQKTPSSAACNPPPAPSTAAACNPASTAAASTPQTTTTTCTQSSGGTICTTTITPSTSNSGACAAPTLPVTTPSGACAIPAAPVLKPSSNSSACAIPAAPTLPVTTPSGACASTSQTGTTCTKLPSGGTVCTTQDLDKMSMNDLISGVTKDVAALQKESDNLLLDVKDAREYTTKMINEIMRMVKGLERFQK